MSYQWTSKDSGWVKERKGLLVKVRPVKKVLYVSFNRAILEFMDQLKMEKKY
jgi:hypothetical protein